MYTQKSIPVNGKNFSSILTVTGQEQSSKIQTNRPGPEK